MLILTRRPTETIICSVGTLELSTSVEISPDLKERLKGLDISITVLEVRGNQVRIGINAPRYVTVDREEIYERRKLEAQTGVPQRGPKPAQSGNRK